MKISTLVLVLWCFYMISTVHGKGETTPQLQLGAAGNFVPLAKSYNLPGHTVKATMWDCNTSGCHLQGFKFLSINLKGIELQRAPGKNPEVANHCHCVRQVLD
ncbi:hypothetical protein V6N11_000375 [Hibiscus sabdariffa]|uniref:Uncharacterized protein n=1 Tax=Hibiscus sabdariffa TaxID=183260 RepID=A0ABR2A8N6_9ROSI